MTLKTQLTSDLDSFFNTDEFAEEITYTAKGEDAVTISAIVMREAPLQEPYVRGPETATCEIIVKISDVATPQHGDTFTLNDSEIWEFDPTNGVIYQDDDVLHILLERRLD